MTDPKPFASLSSGLLARKGAAKPAMRPQSFSPLTGNFEDLGWNDMGHDDVPQHVPSSIAALTPAPRLLGRDGFEPDVIEQQRAIASTFATEDDSEEEEVFGPAQVAPLVAATPPAVIPLTRKTRQAPGTKEKAAFTLRLDRERHLKLRLACAVTHRSAQQIVIEALERHLSAMPELDTIARQLPAKAGNRN